MNQSLPNKTLDEVSPKWMFTFDERLGDDYMQPAIVLIKTFEANVITKEMIG